MNASSMCVSCIISKQEKLIRQYSDETRKSEYMHRILEIFYRHGQTQSAPWIAEQINLLCEESRKALFSADVSISKGQGNFESLYGEGLNPYYLFLCKCELFVQRFGLARYESVFAREERIRVV